MKKLPLAITTFEKIRAPAENYLYVDKTEFAWQLIQNGEYYFLSRPRRFGKSLFLDTLSDLFQGKKSLFKNLAVYQKWDWETRYPVINLSLNTGDFSCEETIKKQLQLVLRKAGKRLALELEAEENIPAAFSELIENAYEKYQQKVVVLIDEYDKPILDNLGNRETALVARQQLKNFYAAIKDNDRYLKFVFITGVSKFSKLNLFSGLNNLTDITLLPDYADICGYTHRDIRTTFAEHLQGVDWEQLERWYNGYHYLGSEQQRVYNPYDILLFINHHCEYKNYWWGTGNPSFLIQKLQEQNYYIPALENMIVNEEILDTFDIEKIDLIALLWQTGYLTLAKKIKNFDETFDYQLKVPNREIQKSLNQLFINYLTDQAVESLQYQKNIYQAISNDINALEDTLKSLFASIPYHNYANTIIARYEGYYASVVFTYLMALGFPSIAEDTTEKGRIDLTLHLPKRIIILEFKVDRSEPALAQIKAKKYYQKYLTQARQKQQEIYLVGIHFDSQQRNIVGFDWELLEQSSC